MTDASHTLPSHGLEPLRRDGDLLPCPFCGGRCVTFHSGGPGNYFVRCDDCFTSSNDVQKDRAIALWNTRAPLPGAIAQTEKVQSNAVEQCIEAGAKAIVGYCQTSHTFDRKQGYVSERIWRCVALASPAASSWQPSEQERHAIGHARYQVERARPEFPEVCFDYELILTLLKIIDRTSQVTSTEEK